MCDTWISGSTSCCSYDPNWLDKILNQPEEIILYKRKPHFRYSLRGWFNVRLCFHLRYMQCLKQGIQLRFRLLRFKDGFV